MTAEAFKALLDAAYAGGFQSIANTACRLLNNPVAIYDLGLRNLAYSKNEHPKFETFQKYTRDAALTERRAMHFIEEDYLDRLRKKGEPMLIDDAATRRLMLSPVYVNGALMGYVNVVEAYSPFGEGDGELLGEICRVVSIEMRKDPFFHDSPRVMKERFLTELLENSEHSREYITARTAALGLKTGDTLFAASIGGGVEERAFDGLRALSGEYLSAVSNGRLALLTRGDFFKREDVLAYMSAHGLSAGVSGGFSDLRDAKRRYGQAFEALEAAVYVSLPGHVFYYFEMSPYCLLKRAGADFDALDCVHPAVTALLEHDESNGTELVETLRIYLKNLRALLKTKDELHIHRNTLIYRLKRISELTGVDLSDGETVFRLCLSFKALKFAGRIN